MTFCVQSRAVDHDALHDAQSAAVAGAHNAELAVSIPADVKAALRPYVHPIVSAVFGVVKAGVDAGLARIPIAGSFAAAIVNPIIDKLEPAVEAKLTALLA